MAYETDGLGMPPRLWRLAQRMAAEEVASVYRHDLVGKLGAARMLVHTVRRRVLAEGSPFASDDRLLEAFTLADSAVKGALVMAERPLMTSTEEPHDPTDLAELATAFVGGAGIARIVAVAPAPTWVDADADELTVALASLLENALEAHPGSVEVRCAGAEGFARLEVVDHGPPFVDPPDDAPSFASDKPGRLGIGLRLVKRVARRWGGTFELIRDGETTVARLELPLIRGAGSEETQVG